MIYIERYQSNVTPVLRPINISGRSTKQIVADMEGSRLASILIGMSPISHTEECRCEPCIQIMLDAFVRKSEVLTNDLQSDSAGSAYGDIVPSSAGANQANLYE